jgi:hypothetical protein
MEIEAIRQLIAECQFGAYTFNVKVDGRGAWYLQGEYDEEDITNGKQERQYTRRWFLSPEATKSEIVQTVFKCAITSMEHRTREWFLFRGKAIFGPHFDVEALWLMCADNRLDKRQPYNKTFSELPQEPMEKLWDETVNR